MTAPWAKRHKGPDPDRVILVASATQPARFCDNSVTNSKYTVINFISRALWEQFQRLANVYFLAMGFLMLLGTYSDVFQTPLTAFTTLFPLSVVLTVSLIQEGLADMKRHRSDDETNNRTSTITHFNSGKGVTSAAVRWRDIQVGDLIRVSNKQPLPADVVVLATGEDENVCYIETSSIDGETNLKLRRAIQVFGDNQTHESVIERLEAEKGEIRCEAPNTNINAFAGAYHVPGKEPVPIDNDNICLRGSVIRNTKWMVGLVIFTGEDTKLQRNARHAPSKLSRIDLLVNRAIYVIFLTDLILVTISTILLLAFEARHFAQLTYVGYHSPTTTPAWAIGKDVYSGMHWRTHRTSFIEGWLTFIVLFNNFIPISMYVTLEVMTYVHLFLVNEDRTMYHEESDTPAKARSNIVTDLGQIDFVFSDKTGTLTQNVMKFKRCSVAGKVYGAPILLTDANAILPYVNVAEVNQDARPGSLMDDFLKVLSICHTVVVEKDPALSNSTAPTAAGIRTAKVVVDDDSRVAAKIEYQAESPDEKALVEAARDFGYELVGRNTSGLVVRIHGRNESWTPLAVNKFDSTRKRMSIVVKDKHGNIRLLCKGADSGMLGRGTCGGKEESETLVEHLKTFAQEGLRTLVLGYRDLDAKEFDEWQQEFKEATFATQDRAEKLSMVADKLESDMKLVGITAIEDKLQDGVPETIADLSKAGIKVCVLTGDKMETAINIGYSCKVLVQGMTLLQLGAGTEQEVEVGLCKLYRAVQNKCGGGPGAFCHRPAPEQAAILRMLHRHVPDFQAPELSASQLAHQQSISTPATPPITTPATGISIQVRSDVVEREEGPASKPVNVRFTEGTKAPSRLKSMEEPTEFGFVMEGPALINVLGKKAMEVMLFDVMRQCKAVIACRVSPKQKAQLVRLVKKNVKPMPVTLAIGDGANDVGMIQEAHVGIGISGNEGQQAVNASDFAVAQFRFLKRLLLVHGRWDYRRNSKVVLYSFYKNLVLVMTLFFFLFSCGFSGTALFEDNILAGYNFFLGLPIFTLGLFDQDVTAEFAMDNPHMYVSGRKNLDLNVFQVVKWISAALLHGFFVYYLTLWTVPQSTTVRCQSSFYTFGLALYAVLIITMDYKVMLEFKTITRPQLGKDDTGKGVPRCSMCGWTVWVWVGSVLSFFLAAFVYGGMLNFAPKFYNVPQITFTTIGVWLQILLIPMICVGADMLYVYVTDEFFPSPVVVGVEKNRCMPQVLVSEAVTTGVVIEPKEAAGAAERASAPF